MPYRSTRITIFNQSTRFTLKRGINHFDHGQYTDGWEAPATVAPGQDPVGFQAESAGLGTGAEGWVNYTVVDSSGASHGEISIYWDNPTVPTSDTVFLSTAQALNGFTYDPLPPKSADGFAAPMDFGFSGGLLTGWDGKSGLTAGGVLGSLFVTGPLFNWAPQDGYFAGVRLVDQYPGGLSSGPSTSYTSSYPGVPSVGEWVTVPGSLFASADGSVQIAIAAPSKSNTTSVSIKVVDQAAPAINGSYTVDLTTPADVGTWFIASKTSARSVVPPVGLVHPLAHAGEQSASHASQERSSEKALAPSKVTTPAEDRKTLEKSVAGVSDLAHHLVQRTVELRDERIALTLLRDSAHPGTPDGLHRALRYQRYSLLGAVTRDVVCVYREPPPR